MVSTKICLFCYNLVSINKDQSLELKFFLSFSILCFVRFSHIKIFKNFIVRSYFLFAQQEVKIHGKYIPPTLSDYYEL